MREGRLRVAARARPQKKPGVEIHRLVNIGLRSGPRTPQKRRAGE
jgi:hypothetical protein